MRGINEECGVFGIFNCKKASEFTYFGLHNLQHRGQEGAGIVSSDGNTLKVYKNLGLISEVFKDENVLENRLKGSSAIGHVRYSTSGEKALKNVQPFLFDFYDMSVGLCHNGNLINYKSLRLELEKEGAIFHSSSDTEILIHLIRKSKKDSFDEKLKESLCKLKGGFTYLLITKDCIYGAVDPNALRPLVIGKIKEDTYVLASETCALDAIGAEFVANLSAGQFVKISSKGLEIDFYTKPERIAIAAMEYVYFARPDSNIYGINVHSARKRMGKILAKEQPIKDVDMVIGVPNSSLSAASGYAEVLNIPYEMGLIKNQYVARTFIEPTQELRERGVKMKLSAVKGVVKGKKIVLVDDSIVRGTTCKRIVKLLKDAGALEVHVRIASPAILFPSFYGIDISKTEELIAANKTIDEVAKYLGADSLKYLSEDGLIKAIGLNEDAPYKGLCMDCFNGDYVAGLYDYEDEYINSMTEIQKNFLKNKERG